MGGRTDRRRYLRSDTAHGRVVCLMPHPEHATEALTGPSDDGLGLFLSVLDGVLSA